VFAAMLVFPWCSPGRIRIPCPPASAIEASPAVPIAKLDGAH
jgi:hypothetical protein